MKEMIYDAVFEQLNKVDNTKESNDFSNIEMLKNVSVNVEGHVDVIKKKLSDIISLQEGDILKLNKNLSQGITIKINDKKILDSTVIKLNDKISLKVKDFY